MTTKYTAQLDGHTFKRTTANRTYTHMVVVEYDIAIERARELKRAASDWDSNLAYYQKLASGVEIGNYPDYIRGENGPYHSNPYLDRAACRADHDKRAIADRDAAIALLAAGKDAYVASHMERFEELINGRWMTPDGTGYYTDAGWCGRPDLAQKLAAKYAGRAAVRRTVILPAVQS